MRIDAENLRLTPETGLLDPTSTSGLAPEVFKATFGTDPMKATRVDAQVTFALDADTSSFQTALQTRRQGQMPAPESVQAEHFINSVPQEYPEHTGPEAFRCYADGGHPFWAPVEGRALVSVGVVLRSPAPSERRPLNLVICLDASGSMAREGGLDRVLPALRSMAAGLSAQDRLAIVTFDERARLALPATHGDKQELIEKTFTDIHPSGGTSAAEGILLAYQVAADLSRPDATSRVLFITDGSTVGQAQDLIRDVKGFKTQGILLTILGCGEQPVAGSQLEALADAADGESHFLGAGDESLKQVTQRLLPANLETLARDSKAQVTWNPDRVLHHRLIGYEARRLKHQDFRDNRVDAGELNAKVQVTALFEISLRPGSVGPLGEVGVRAFDTRLEQVREVRFPLPGSLIREDASPRLRLTAAAAATAEWLRAGWWSNTNCLNNAAIRKEIQSITGLSPAAETVKNQLLEILK
jgi:Ca-activated chloride channel family protein